MTSLTYCSIARLFVSIILWNLQTKGAFFLTSLGLKNVHNQSRYKVMKFDKIKMNYIRRKLQTEEVRSSASNIRGLGDPSQIDVEQTRTSHNLAKIKGHTTTQCQFLSLEVHFLSLEIHFLSLKVHFLSLEVRFQP